MIIGVRFSMRCSTAVRHVDKVSVFWFRRDLRLDDNHGLHRALESGHLVLPIFIFDTNILDDLEPYDRRVDYLHQALSGMHDQLREASSGIRTFHAAPEEVFRQLIAEYNVQSVFCNWDYEPDARNRDRAIYEVLKDEGIPFKGYKDQVIFERGELVKQDGSPYTVYTPYSNKWKASLRTESVQPFTTSFEGFYQWGAPTIQALEEIGFEKTDVVFNPPELDEDLIRSYDQYRNYPALDRTTRLSVALRFGTISIRNAVAIARETNETWLNELIWREFFMQILYHFPYVVDRCFKEKYEFITWRNRPDEFEKWANGQTGYPIVDAGMRELNATGFMHNRVRMITASFLTKHLLIDWRWGEAWFAEKLIDYDLAANNGNWQWVAGCGCDAAPYFRVFNPDTQTTKFDPDREYIQKWVHEVDSPDYPPPMVEHAFARERAIATYRKGLEAVARM